MEVLGVIIFIICCIVMLFTDDTSAEDSYEIHKYWQGE